MSIIFHLSLSVSLCLFLSLSVSLCLFLCLSVSLFLSPSPLSLINQSVKLSLSSLPPSLSPAVSLFQCLCLSVCLSVCPSVSLSLLKHKFDRSNHVVCPDEAIRKAESEFTGDRSACQSFREAGSNGASSLQVQSFLVPGENLVSRFGLAVRR